MQLLMENWRRYLKEGSQWGGFTGGAAPLDEPIQDSGVIPPDQLKKMWELYIEMGMSPEEVLQTQEFIEAGITSPEQFMKEGRDWFDDPELMASIEKQGKWFQDLDDALIEIDISRGGEGYSFQDYFLRKDIENYILKSGLDSDPNEVAKIIYKMVTEQ